MAFFSLISLVPTARCYLKNRSESIYDPPAILQNVLGLVLQIFLYSVSFVHKPYGLASQKLCYLKTATILEKQTKNVLANVW